MSDVPSVVSDAAAAEPRPARGEWWCPTGRHTRSGTRSGGACRACATNASERATALVVTQLDGLAVERAAELVGRAVRTRDGLEQLIGHLQAHPDALHSGDSDCPKVVINLLAVLVAAGVDGAAHARCVRCGHPRRHLQTVTVSGRVCESCRNRTRTEPCLGCGRTAPVHRRTSAGTWCQRCTAADQTRWQPCSRCATPGPVIMRIEGRPVGPCCYVEPVIRCTMCGIAKGVKPWKSRRPVCAACAVLDRVECGGCGRDAAAPPAGREAICAVCSTITARPCTGCTRPTPGRDRAGAPRCPDCYQRPVRACGRCGRVRAVVRLAVGDDPELCAVCWTGPTVECAQCGQLRPCRGERRARMLCSGCAPVAPQHCAHCGKPRRVCAHWHEGPVCAPCYNRALAAKGRCPQCGHTRRLMPHPGWPNPVCSTCAGAPPLAVCTGCGTEDALYRRGLCPACSLHRVLDEVLGDAAVRAGSGLQPVVDRLVELDRPRWVLDWLTRERSSASILTRFATGELPLTHEAFDRLPAGRAAWFVERLLVATGALPDRDPVLARMERWTRDYLAGIVDADRRRLLGRYATWQLLRPLRARSQTAALSDTVPNARKQRLKTANALLIWLDEQGRGLSECTQAVLDRWAVTGPARWADARPFLVWAGEQHLVGALDFPARPPGGVSSLIGTDQRWALTRRLLHDPGIDPVVRVAGLLVVLYAQPAARISRLRHDDVVVHGVHVELRLGSSPIRIPPPLSHHLVALTEPRRAATVSAVRGDQPWLFPGRMPGRPGHSGALRERLRAAGVPTAVHRASALAHLASTMPAAIVADLLGVSIKTATSWAARTGRTWTDYTANR